MAVHLRVRLRSFDWWPKKYQRYSNHEWYYDIEVSVRP